MPVVVADTNVFIAAHWNQGSASSRLLQAAEEGRLLLAVSDDVVREIRHILGSIRARADYRDRVERLLSTALWVDPWVRLAVVAGDADDNKLLECAVAARADYLATNDDHLLSLREFAGTRILPPSSVVLRALSEAAEDAASARERVEPEERGAPPVGGTFEPGED